MRIIVPVVLLLVVIAGITTMAVIDKSKHTGAYERSKERERNAALIERYEYNTSVLNADNHIVVKVLEIRGCTYLFYESRMYHEPNCLNHKSKLRDYGE